MTSELTKRVLVIEDYDPVAAIEAHLATMEGYEVTVARTSDEGMARLADHRPDLVLLDLMLPGTLSGEAVLQSILADAESPIRVLVISALLNPALASRLELDSRVSTLAKPFQVRDLSARIRTLMEA